VTPLFSHCGVTPPDREEEKGEKHGGKRELK
jgi:hypothetical protein